MTRLFGIRTLWRFAALAWWRWAQSELQSMNPHHPDLFNIALRIVQLEES